MRNGMQAFTSASKRTSETCDHHVQSDPHRRRDDADQQVEDDDDPEVHGVDPELRHDRHQGRNRDQQQRGKRLQDCPQHQQEHVDNQQDHELVVGEAPQPLRQDHRGALDSDQPAHGGGDRDDVHDQRGGDDAFLDDGHQRPDADGAEDEAQEQGIEGGEDSGLVGGHDAADHAPDDDHGSQQGEEPVTEARHHPAERPLERRRAGLPAACHAEVDEDHEKDADHDARQHAGEEHFGDRDVGHDGVDDHHDAGRDDRPDGGRADGHGGAERLVVACPLHGLDLDGAEARRVGQRRSGDPREDHTGKHVDLGQTALDAAHHAAREVEYLLGDAERVHHVPGEDEERDRQQGDGLGAVRHLLRNRQQVVAAGHEGDAGRQPDGDGHRDAEGT